MEGGKGWKKVLVYPSHPILSPPFPVKKGYSFKRGILSLPSPLPTPTHTLGKKPRPVDSTQPTPKMSSQCLWFILVRRAVARDGTGRGNPLPSFLPLSAYPIISPPEKKEFKNGFAEKTWGVGDKGRKGDMRPPPHSPSISANSQIHTQTCVKEREKRGMLHRAGSGRRCGAWLAAFRSVPDRSERGKR